MDKLENNMDLSSLLLEGESNLDIVVVKIGTTTLTGGNPTLNRDTIDKLADQVQGLLKGAVDGKPRQVILVSSAAIAMGREILGGHQLATSTARETTLTKQMLAAIGQPELMQLYQQSFARHQILTAQALLSYSDFATPQQHLYARETLRGLLQQGIVPIVNENDVVATEEIKFGDNDRLSAMVAELVGANVLIILTDIDGLYTANPRLDETAHLIDEVALVDADVLAMAGASIGGQGTGGMYSKVMAAQLATRANIKTVIVNGKIDRVMLKVIAGEKLGTRFLAGVGVNK